MSTSASGPKSKYAHELLEQLLVLQKDSEQPELALLDAVFSFINDKGSFLATPKMSKKVVDLAHSHIDAAKQKEISSRMDALTKGVDIAVGTEDGDVKMAETSTKKKKKPSSRGWEKPADYIDPSEMPALVPLGKVVDGSSEDAPATAETVAKAVGASKKKATASAMQSSADVKMDTSAKPKKKVTIKEVPFTKKPPTEMAAAKATPSASGDADEDKEESDDGVKLVGNGGTTDKYSWTQTLKEVEVQFSFPVHLRGKHFDVQIRKNRLKVGLKRSTAIVDGELTHAVIPDECTWTLVTDGDHKVLSVSLTKKNGMEWWAAVVKGDPEIDTKKIEPENSKLDDLDDETRKVVSRMMFDQKQKMKGEPTSKELEQRGMLAKLQSKFPDMDFSKAKVSGAGAGGGFGGGF